MIDNFELIKPLLTFPNDDIYYLESLDYVEDEIKKLCEFFGARAYINLAPKSIKKTTMLQIKYLAQRAYEGDFKKIWKSWNTCAGEIKGEESRWVVDIDNTTNSIFDKKTKEIMNYIHHIVNILLLHHFLLF